MAVHKDSEATFSYMQFFPRLAFNFAHWEALSIMHIPNPLLR